MPQCHRKAAVVPPGPPSSLAGSLELSTSHSMSPPPSQGNLCPRASFLEQLSSGSGCQDGSSQAVPFPRGRSCSIPGQQCRAVNTRVGSSRFITLFLICNQPPLNPPLFPLLLLGSLFWWKLCSLCSRALEQSDGSHSTVLTHKGSCTCFDLHFSNASGGISISEMHFFCKVSMFFFSSTKLAKNKKKRKNYANFFFILKLSCDLYLSSPEACEKTFLMYLKLYRR